LELRKHQEKAIDMLRESFKKGNKRVVLGAPCSFGKTVLSAYLLKKFQVANKTAMFVCDRLKLVDQTIKTFDKYEINYGVIQGDHPKFNLNKTIQVASTQTLSRRTSMLPTDFDLIIIDECHIQYRGLMDYLKTCKESKIIGLSATPISRGLGNFYQDLIVPIKPRELLEMNYLAPIKYFVGQTIDTSRVRTRALPTGGQDYHPDDIGALYENNNILTGHIVQNWLEYGENKQTIAFCSSIKHSKYLVETFEKEGISARHIDGYMNVEERRKLFREHDEGKFKILSCSKLLNTGYDAPTVGCLIDCKPTRSIISYVQTYGRIMRIAENKPYAIVLDHASNVPRFGMAEDVVPNQLHKGTERFREQRQVEPKEKPTVACPQCKIIFTGFQCACGYKLPQTKRIEFSDEMLVEYERNQVKSEYSDREKKVWYENLKTLEFQRNYKNGFAEMIYKDKFKEYPPKNKRHRLLNEVNDEVKNYVKSRFIRYAKSKQQRERRQSNGK
jgi:superfamily II DNA or RNA helicase